MKIRFLLYAVLVLAVFAMFGCNRSDFFDILVGDQDPVSDPIVVNERIVPVFSVLGLTGTKSMAIKSMINNDNVDQGIIALCATMFQGFSTAPLEGDTYQTDVVDEPYNFTVTEVAAGTKFESISDDGTLSVIVNEATKEFSVIEDFFFDYNVTEWGIGTVYRKTSTPISLTTVRAVSTRSLTSSSTTGTTIL